MYTYRQQQKNKVRQLALEDAVKKLTTLRGSSCCVRESYVRDLRNYFLDDEDSKCCQEAARIPSEYVAEWERLHFACSQDKRPEHLCVCYLAGPEPKNDFEELASLGILPQNIWAFESDKGVFRSALRQCAGNGFAQPKLIGMSVENFLEYSPKRFDIVYFDFCSTLLSARRSLRAVVNLFRYHKLNSPGVLITNFCVPDTEDLVEYETMSEAMAIYFYIKSTLDKPVEMNQGSIADSEFLKLRKEIEADFLDYYSNFITSIISNIASVAVPANRLANSPAMLANLVESIDEVDSITRDSIHVSSFGRDGFAKALFVGGSNSKIKELELVLRGLPLPRKDPLLSLAICHQIKTNEISLAENFRRALSVFGDGGTLYQFLDKPSFELVSEYAIRQLSYPMHYCPESSKRYEYKAKTKKMMVDISLFDECRYLYDWIPAYSQIDAAKQDVGMQYVLRFALDGLIKQRILYDSDFFYSGSVVSSYQNGFTAANIPCREKIK